MYSFSLAVPMPPVGIESIAHHPFPLPLEWAMVGGAVAAGAAVRSGESLHQPIEEGAKSVLLCHLGNIAQWTGRALRIDAKTGHIEADAEAMGYWQREYAPGWAPVV